MSVRQMAAGAAVPREACGHWLSDSSVLDEIQWGVTSTGARIHMVGKFVTFVQSVMLTLSQK